ncbi:hypothetical protein RH915_04695 [Serpentinicella sp. ANB-PHB4]|uniref:hypothetical protein n=1 Tax=Serpentinicella sp. ANB-PHB4 TaxID=3074076 RepID=UPI00285623A2|nr:hypothetical protein [Serpentinicella sp. ANB-PHB4]MDR5658782.1 hypothetical protein [Serpentinicella sp. ANB-PHB4]
MNCKKLNSLKKSETYQKFRRGNVSEFETNTYQTTSSESSNQPLNFFGVGSRREEEIFQNFFSQF